MRTGTVKDSFARDIAIKSMASMEESGDADAALNEAVARRAYDKFVSRGYVNGMDVEDWLTAEREVKGDTSSRFN